MLILNLLCVLLVFSDFGKAYFHKKYVGAGTKMKNMYAHVSSTARLPCPVNPTLCGKLHSVKWYKDTSRIYVLSQTGGTRRSEGDAKERMKVEYPSEAGQAILQIDDVHIEDEAIYKCEITYIEVKESCHDVVQVVNLTTLVKPENVQIIGNDSKPMTNGSILGPKEEGSEVDLLCRTGRGKPIPKVNWYNDTTLIDRAQYTTTDLGDGSGIGSSKLQLTLSRGDLKAKFECRVESIALDEPIVSWVIADVHVRPTHMELSGVKNHVVQGTNVLLICDVFGAKPAATIRWTNNSNPIRNENLLQTELVDNRDGTFSTKSQLTFQATHWENGMKVHCYAENEVTKHHFEPEMHKVLILEVRYPPVISVRPTYITINESTAEKPTNGTLLICSYKANPQELKGALWSKDGKNLTLTDSKKYKGGTIENPPLIIYNVTRTDMGEYSCWLKNEVGSEQSAESIFLNVQYPPDVEVLMDPSTPVKALDKTDVMLQCNITSGNPSKLLKVRWFLNDILMKELPECNETTSNKEESNELCPTDVSLLKLERVGTEFAGSFVCQAQNDAGWGPKSAPVDLIVYYPPSPAKISFSPSLVVKGGEVNLECKVDDLGRPNNVTYIWYRGSHQMTEITTSNHTVSPVRLETRSNYTCIAVNEGGQSQPATTFIDVSAPPALFDRLKPYQGILYSAEQVNLTCRVECFPLCNIIWKKNGLRLDTTNNFYYYNKTVWHPPDLQKNIFESIESTLIWNMTARPGNMLNRTAPNSNYTCQSEPNQIGPGVSSTIEIAVDYPPEDVYVSSNLIKVIEGQAPNPVKCHGKGHPNLTYKWKKNTTSEAKESGDELRLGPMTRTDPRSYICEASNKHGKKEAKVYFDVQFAPECSITRTEKDNNPALLCTVQANPENVNFYWKVSESNETYPETSNIFPEGLRSFLILDSTVDTKRTYQCYANNSVGFNEKQPCVMDVAASRDQSSPVGDAGILPWWKRLNQEKLIIIVASIVAIIIFIIILCIIIILLCRRERSNTKYNNPLEMEEREKTDGQNSMMDQSKWPLESGLLININKMENKNMKKNTLNQFTSKMRNRQHIKTNTLLSYRRNKSKFYARLRRFRDALKLNNSNNNSNSHSNGDRHMPFGLYAGASGVLTFKKIQSSPQTTSRLENIISRKRKKPGDVPPNPSSIAGDKIRQGVVPPVGNMPGHPLSNSTDPNDKGLYENLPFHGLPNPPNKPISVIAPFYKDTKLTMPSAKRQSNLNQSLPLAVPLFSPQLKPKFSNSTLKRNQTFSGMPHRPVIQQQTTSQLPWATQYSIFMRTFGNPQFLNRHSLNTDFNTIGVSQPAIPKLSMLSLSNTNQKYQENKYYIPLAIPPQPTTRVVGRNEANFEQKRLNTQIEKLKLNAEPPTKLQEVPKETPTQKKTVLDKKFNSLRTEKHKCYSPTFYSMRCKKHAKKRPVIYALPKKYLNQLPTNAEISKTNNFENLTDSIQIMEQTTNGNPIPAPRCKKHKRQNIVYANICNSLKRNLPLRESPNNSSSDSAEYNQRNATSGQTSIVAADVHAENSENLIENERGPLVIELQEKLPTTTTTTTAIIITSPSSIQTPLIINKPKIIDTSPKPSCQTKLVQSIAPMPIISPQAMKNSPILKVTPNFIKPKVESPKGALSLQIQAKKIKSSPSQCANDSNLSVMSLKEKREENENLRVAETIVPVKGSQQVGCQNSKKLLDNDIATANNNNKQNAFYTLTTPHSKQTIMPPQYSATIPHHPKHHSNKLLPKALFQEQLSKSKSFSSKNKKNFQMPLQKYPSLKFQTAESYFQPIKNIHEENLMRNGYMSDYPSASSMANFQHRSNVSRHHKRDKPKQKTKGPLVLRHPDEFQGNIQDSVQLQYPQPILPSATSSRDQNHQGLTSSSNILQNGIIQYADLDMPAVNSRKSSHESSSSSSSKSHHHQHQHQQQQQQNKKPNKAKTEYATLKFNDVGQEIDV